MKTEPVSKILTAGSSPLEIRERERPLARRSAAVHRSDVVIEEEIWNGILRDRSLGPKYQENITVEVEQGRVKLRGHIQKEWHGPLIANIIDRIEGVVLVRNELVPDSVLQEQVIPAMMQDEVTSPYIFMVRSSFGWIHLGGLVPSREISKAAEGVAGFVPGVRGILSLPSVFHAAWLPVDEPEPVRRTIQPRLAASVFQDGDDDRSALVGLVSQVIIDPCSRLVESFAVRMPAADAGQDVPPERLVPMSAVESGNEWQVWLKEGESLDAYPAFDRSRYPLPPANWRPPFPYQPGLVRWAIVA